MTLREQRNRVIEALREWGLALDRAEGNGHDLRRLIHALDDVDREAYLEVLLARFAQAVAVGDLNVVEHQTLGYIVRNYAKSTLAERFVVATTYLELRSKDTGEERAGVMRRYPVLNRAW